MGNQTKTIPEIGEALTNLPGKGINIQPKDTSKGHFYVSLVKSFLRITGFVTLFLAGADPEMMTSWLKVTAGFLMLAECLGILEELV